MQEAAFFIGAIIQIAHNGSAAFAHRTGWRGSKYTASGTEGRPLTHVTAQVSGGQSGAGMAKWGYDAADVEVLPTRAACQPDYWDVPRSLGRCCALQGREEMPIAAFRLGAEESHVGRALRAADAAFETWRARWQQTHGGR